MSEFSTSATIDVTVSPDSLRQARGTIEDELGDVQVNVSNTSGGSGGSRVAGRERAMGRQLQSETNEHLAGIDSHWTENLDLNRDRNDLLRQLVDVTEKDAQTSSGGSGMISGGLGLALGGISLGSMVLGSVGEKLASALPELKPSDVIKKVRLTASDVIDTAAEIDPEDTIAEAATMTPAAVITSKAAMAATDVVGEKAAITPTDTIAELATITPAAVIASKVAVVATDVIEAKASINPADTIAELATITPAAVIASKAAVVADDVIDSAAEVNPADTIAELATITPGVLIASKATLEAGDIVSGTISATAIIEKLVEKPQSNSNGSPNGGGDIGLREILGSSAVAGTAVGISRSQRLRRLASKGGRGTAGLTTPVITRDMMLSEDEAASNRKRARKMTPDWMDPMFPADAPWENSDRESVKNWSTNTGQKIENTVEVNADLSDLERETSDKINELEKEVGKLKNSLSGW